MTVAKSAVIRVKKQFAEVNADDLERSVVVLSSARRLASKALVLRFLESQGVDSTVEISESAEGYIVLALERRLKARVSVEVFVLPVSVWISEMSKGVEGVAGWVVSADSKIGKAVVSMINSSSAISLKKRVEFSSMVLAASGDRWVRAACLQFEFKEIGGGKVLGLKQMCLDLLSRGLVDSSGIVAHIAGERMSEFLRVRHVDSKAPYILTVVPSGASGGVAVFQSEEVYQFSLILFSVDARLFSADFLQKVKEKRTREVESFGERWEPGEIQVLRPGRVGLLRLRINSSLGFSISIVLNRLLICSKR